MIIVYATGRFAVADTSRMPLYLCKLLTETPFAYYGVGMGAIAAPSAQGLCAGRPRASCIWHSSKVVMRRAEVGALM